MCNIKPKKFVNEEMRKERMAEIQKKEIEWKEYQKKYLDWRIIFLKKKKSWVKPWWTKFGTLLKKVAKSQPSGHCIW